MEVTSDNHVAFIVIAAVVGLVWSILMIVIRIFLRIVGAVQTSVTLHAVHNGIGKQEDLLAPDQTHNGLKQHSVGYRSHGISEPLISVIAWYSPYPAFHGKYAFVRWTVVETGNMLIELLIPGLIIMVLWNLQARLKAKITVLVAFSMQLLVTIPTVFRLILLHEMTTVDIRNDRTFAIANTVVLTEITMHFSLMAATFPCLRKFLQAFDTNLGATTHMITDPDDPKQTGSNGSYGLRSLDRPSRAKGTNIEHWSRNCNRYNRKYQPHTVTTVSAGVGDPSGSPEGNERVQRQRTRNHDLESGGVGSDDSQLTIIRRTQHWEVTVESRGN
ncbi:hypothetical protein BDV38DRAFT_290191 [Aspergillus pseudotamarii]|uniref:Rhodopsin domain-containing protein n=1 Tax=Aspergillus pseudotamarii TaxID=132259 RepID=A0A5N6T2F0_ASPPS|nr:uncharacterized protein BDV38DRAFT_290191 [Aspergillus pseudotamarii]KAE8140474.1 hypothetical protein BDV38DRAFT_290191 [Aspergillus pseudotamarii]